MGEELVSGSSLPNGDRVDKDTLSSFSFSKAFEEHLPFFLMCGMTYEQYYYGDVELCRYYRKADEMRRKRKNEELWLQGMYIYEAIIDVAPALRPMGAAQPTPYSKEPYPLTEEERKEREIRDEKLRFKKMLEKMTELAETRGGEGNGNTT